MTKTKKELLREYKEMKIPMGIYRLTNRVNGRVLIGSSLDLNATWNSLRAQLKLGSHFLDADLQADWKIYGEENFTYETLDIHEPAPEETNHRQALKLLQEMWLEKLMPENMYGKRG